MNRKRTIVEEYSSMKELEGAEDQHPTSNQTVSLDALAASLQLGVSDRTVRRWIVEGWTQPSGKPLFLKAHSIRNGRAKEWVIYQDDLDAFQKQRDHGATEGIPANQLMIVEEEDKRALTTSMNLLRDELEQRSLALEEAQATIERLAAEAGRQTGRNEAYERERTELLRQMAQLQAERDHWQQKAWELQSKMPKKVRLFGWKAEE
jgi:hypothetical protein